MQDHVIAITGSNGKVRSRVARRFAALGAHQRLLVRDPKRAVPVEGAETRAVSGYRATEEMRAALAGHTAFS